MLDKGKVKALCREHSLNCRYFGDRVIVDTNTDQWEIVSKPVGVYNNFGYADQVIELRHKNISGNKSGKAHFHRQRIVEKIEHAFDTIVEHNDVVPNYQKTIDLIKQL